MSEPARQEPQRDSYNLFDHEEGVLQRSYDMIHNLDLVSTGLRELVEAYRTSYRESQRLVRISDRLQADLQQANQALSEQAHELQALNSTLQAEIEQRKHLEQELRRLALVDDLTGLGNRRHLLELGEHEIRRQARSHLTMSLLLADLDHFKKINDSHGHAAGDHVLQRFAEIFRTNVRAGDIAGRFGGEEFVAIFPETDLATALEVAERIRTALEAATCDHAGQTLQVTVSIGVTECIPDEPLNKALARADRALYQAKDTGRNRIVTNAPPQRVRS